MSKVMIVEDDPMLVEIYEKKLTAAGFSVKVVSTGKMVKDEMTSWKPEIVLLDMVLPDMDGFEILEAVKNDPAIKDIPVYVFSNLSAKEDMERTKALGASGFLTKSNFTPSQLADEVKKLLNNPDLTPPAAAAPAEANQVGPENAPVQAEPIGHKVLIIEDEDIFIDMFGDKLKQEGFEVVAAKNGKWGLKEAEKGGFCCILLDMLMPAMNGYEAVQELRANEITKSIPIIILSNSALDSEVQKALELGASAYYIKTKITPGEVAEKVKELVKSQ